ncbi:MAG: nucleotide exchange factor GrpE [Planctomycetaceae bacterium]|nr:nucleotide exchange factor GrpE [Planctomycetaceae bacterium]
MKHEHDDPHDIIGDAQSRDMPMDDALFPDDEPLNEAGEKTVESLENELRQANDRTLRAYAELDNYRKRAWREIEEMRKYAPIDLIRDMLGVWDNMGRALEAVETNHNPNAFVEGVRMMHEQFTQMLARHHCTRIEAVGQVFDPNVHESIAQMPSNDVPAGSVLFESQIGFKLHDRVVRPTQVVISTGATKDEAPHAK